MATWSKYELFVTAQFADAVIDWDTDTIKIALVSDTPTAATDNYFDDVTEVTAGGSYTAGGITLTCTDANASGTLTVSSATSVTWAQNASSPTNATYAVLYKSTGTASTSPLVAYLNLGQTVDLTAGSLTITLTSNEIFSVT